MDIAKNIKKYAELVVKMGVNVQEGQVVLVRGSVNTVDLARAITTECYKRGAKDVIVDYTDDDITHQRMLKAPMEVIETYPKWRIDGLMTYIEKGACIINIVSSNPDLMADVDPKRIAVSNKVGAEACKEYREYILGSKTCWTIVAYPNVEWAKKVFPDLDEKEAFNKLWENIFKATRVDQDDPLEAWEAHIKQLNKGMDFLNGHKFAKMHYKGPGTDLMVELPQGHIWLGGGDENSVNGTFFLANIPTEETFSMPKKTGVNGTLSSTMPLNYGGNLIDNFKFEFKDGKIVDFSAETGYDTLKNLIDTDEGAHYLGEIALVPDDSPISNTDIIFYNTLFDENASCHFAIGAAYPGCIENGINMTKEDKEVAGVNDSLTHVDFMVGCKELDIMGIKEDGTEVQVFKNGNWAF